MAHRIGAMASMSSSFCRSRASRRRSTDSCCAAMRWPDGAGATMMPEALAGGTQSWLHRLTVSQRRYSVTTPLGTPRTCSTGLIGYGCVSAGSRNRGTGCAKQFESRGSGAREQCVCNEGKTARHANNTPNILSTNNVSRALELGYAAKRALAWPGHAWRGWRDLFGFAERRSRSWVQCAAAGLRYVQDALTTCRCLGSQRCHGFSRRRDEDRGPALPSLHQHCLAANDTPV